MTTVRAKKHTHENNTNDKMQVQTFTCCPQMSRCSSLRNVIHRIAAVALLIQFGVDDTWTDDTWTDDVQADEEDGEEGGAPDDTWGGWGAEARRCTPGGGPCSRVSHVHASRTVVCGMDPATEVRAL
jgi:hypothetical protein